MNTKITLVILLFASLFSLCLNGQTYFDSLENALPNLPEEDKAEVYNKLAEHYQLVDIKKLNDYAQKALEISSTFGDSVNIAIAYYNLGRYEATYGDTEKAFKIYYKALQISERISCEICIGKIYNSLGLINWKINNLNEAVDNFNKAQEYFIKINDKDLIASTINNLGIMYVEHDDYENGLLNFKKSLQLMQQIGNIQKVAIALNNVGYVYELMGNLGLGLKYYQQSLNLADSLHLNWAHANALSNIGNIHIKQGNYQKAEQEVLKAFENAKKFNANSIMLDCARQLTLIYSHFNQFKKALHYNQLHSEIQDSIFNENKNKQILEIQARFETEKKAREIELLQKENVIKALKINRQQNINYLIIALAFVLLSIVLFITIAFRSKQRTNLLLQAKNDEITAQKKAITDSILYSQHIQSATFPELEYFKHIFPDSFIYFNPKEKIGGDFYWLTNLDDDIIIAAADCTGHGVPGALMSMLGITVLNEIVINKTITAPSEILNLMRNKIIRTLQQTDKDESSKDGIDIAICTINKKDRMLKYAGANSPVILYQKGNLQELNPDKMAIHYSHKLDKKFNEQELDFEKGAMLYLYSDGYADQFGGPENKKFLRSNFKNLLSEIQKLPTSKQESILKTRFEEWKGNEIQVDDVMIIGIRL